MGSLQIGPLQLLLFVLLAVVFALGVSAGLSMVLLGMVAACALLIAAFLSTSVSLYLLVFSMLLGPEIMFGGGATDTTIGRGTTFRFDDFLLVVIGFVWLAKAAVFKDVAPVKRTPLNGPMMFYVAACVLATMIGVVAGRVKPLNGFFFNLKYFEYFFLYFMVVNAVRTKAQAQGLVIASLVTCFLVSLYAISQLAEGQRASTPFEGAVGEPNTLGGYLVFMLAITLGLVLTPGALPRKWPFLLLLGIGTLALMATLSRASFLAGGAVLLAILVYASYRKPLLFAVVLALIVSTPVWAPDVVKQRVMFTVNQAAEQGQVKVGRLKIDTSTSDRLRSWERSFGWWKQSPVWGGGITGAPFMDAMYPRMLVETGLLGVATFGSLLWALVRVVRQVYREAQDPAVRGLAFGFLLGLIGLMVHGIGANTFVIVRIMEPFWMFAALLIAVPTFEEAGQDEENEVLAPALSTMQNFSAERPGVA
ncbi:MAG: O-antigen ligase family protein [Nitrospirae bacterium]|nr:O-antigen ligase family protein [Nitrospirota bacterium]